MKVHKLIELSFGVVSGVGIGIRVLDGVQLPQGEGEVLGFFSVPWFEWHIFLTEMYLLVCEKLRIFTYEQYGILLESMVYWFSVDVVKFEVSGGVYEKCAKI